MDLATVCRGGPQFATQTVANDQDYDVPVNSQEGPQPPPAGLRNADKQADHTEKMERWATICSGQHIQLDVTSYRTGQPLASPRPWPREKDGWFENSNGSKDKGISFHLEKETITQSQNTCRKR